MVNWGPEQLQRLEDDSVFAPGRENSVRFVLVGNRCYQPGFCTRRAVFRTFYPKVHGRTVIFLDLAMSENLAEGGRIWMEEIRQDSTLRLSNL